MLVYNISSDSWSTAGGSLNIPRSDGCMSAVGGKLYLAGELACPSDQFHGTSGKGLVSQMLSMQSRAVVSACARSVVSSTWLVSWLALVTSFKAPQGERGGAEGDIVCLPN